MLFNVKTYTKMKGCIHIFCTIDEFNEEFVFYLQYHDVFAKDPMDSPKTSYDYEDAKKVKRERHFGVFMRLY